MNRARIFFGLAYLFGFKPWDSGVPPPQLIELVDGPSALKPSRALDLGCGTGTNCRYLSEHGWDVTGIDFVPRAIGVARRKAPNAKLVVGDVTRLADAGVSGPFGLTLDLGCFHSLPDDRRDAYVSELARVAAPGATHLMFAFGRKERGTPVATEAEIRRRFGGSFEVVEVIPGMAFAQQTWYRLIRQS